MKERIHTRTTSEKGFYVGDLAYAMTEEEYCNEEGVYKLQNLTFAFASIESSADTYTDSKKRKYAVKTGYIGIAPLELCEKSEEELQKYGTVIKAKRGFFDANNGIINAIFDNGEYIIIEENMDYSREGVMRYGLLMTTTFGMGGEQ